MSVKSHDINGQENVSSVSVKSIASTGIEPSKHEQGLSVVKITNNNKRKQMTCITSRIIPYTINPVSHVTCTQLLSKYQYQMMTKKTAETFKARIGKCELV